MRDKIATFIKYRYLLANLISRDLKVKYRRSALGVLWSFLNPIFMMLILNAVFSRLFGNPIENFPLYLISGQIMFGFFTEGTNGALMSVVASSALVKKVYVPKYIFVFEKVLFAFVNLAFSLVAILAMLFMFRIPFSWTMLLFPVPLLTMLVFVLGMGLILATLCVFFRDIQHLYTVITMAWMYLTPIFYSIERNESFRVGITGNIIRFNPLTNYITYFRDVVIYGRIPTNEIQILCFAYAFGFLLIGLLMFRFSQDKFILHI